MNRHLLGRKPTRGGWLMFDVCLHFECGSFFCLKSLLQTDISSFAFIWYEWWWFICVSFPPIPTSRWPHMTQCTATWCFRISIGTRCYFTVTGMLGLHNSLHAVTWCKQCIPNKTCTDTIQPRFSTTCLIWVVTHVHVCSAPSPRCACESWLPSYPPTSVQCTEVYAIDSSTHHKNSPLTRTPH